MAAETKWLQSQKYLQLGRPLLWVDLAVTSVTLLIVGTNPPDLADKVGAPIMGILEETVCSENAFSRELFFSQQCLRHFFVLL